MKKKISPQKNIILIKINVRKPIMCYHLTVLLILKYLSGTVILNYGSGSGRPINFGSGFLRLGVMVAKTGGYT
jgi:hypothetical protein